MADFEDMMQSIVKVSRGQSLHKAAIESAIERALQDLGSSEDLVRTIYICDSMVTFRNDAYLYFRFLSYVFADLLLGITLSVEREGRHISPGGFKRSDRGYSGL